MIAQFSLVSIIITFAITQLVKCYGENDELTPSPLKPYQPVRFSLFASANLLSDKINHCALFSFNNSVPENSENKGDLVIQLLNADSYKMKLYIFENSKDISTKYIDFSNANWTFDIDGKNEYILPANDIKVNENYYIVISTYKLPKTIASSQPTIPYENEITVFNTLNTFEIITKKLFVFYSLYNESHTFKFVIKNSTENSYLLYQILDKENNSNLELEIDKKPIQSLSGYTNIGTQKLINICLNTTKKNAAKGNKFLISFELMENIATFINYTEKKYTKNVVTKSEYYYYLDARKLKTDEERSISLFTNRYKPSVVCKFTKSPMEDFFFNDSFPLSSDNNLCYLNQDRNSDSVYHIYFKNDCKNNTIALLMVSFDTDPLDFFSFSLELSRPPTILTNKNFIQKALQFTSPRYYKIKLNQLSINENLLVYVNLPDVMTVYYGDIYKTPTEIEQVKHTGQFFFINKADSEFSNLPNITIALFNEFTYETIIFETRLFTSSKGLETVFVEQGTTRPEKLIQFQISKCKEKKILLFGVFDKVSNNVMYMNTLYGKTKTLIRNDFEYGNKSLNAVIPNDENAVVFDKASAFNSSIDLITFTCEYPSLSYLNIIPYQQEEIQMRPGDIKLFYVAKENSVRVNFLNNAGYNYELIVLGWKDKFTINVIVGNSSFTLNESHYIHREKFTEEMVNATFELISNSSGNMISFKIGIDKSRYNLFSENLTTIEKNILIYKYPVEKKESTRKVTITFDFTKINNIRILKLCSYQNFGQEGFIHLPTEYDCTTATLRYKVEIDNPYSKEPPENKNYLDEDFFYVIFNFKTNVVNQGTVTVSYAEKQNPVIVKPGELFYFKKGSNYILLEPDETSNFVNFTLTSCGGSKVDLYYYLTDKPYDEFKTNSKLYFIKYKNYKNGGDIVLTSSKESSIFRYFYHNASENQSLPIMNLDIRGVLNKTEKTLFLEFAPFLYNESVTYDIIIMNRSVLTGDDIKKSTNLSNDFISLDNECFMYNFTEKEENQKFYTKQTFEKNFMNLYNNTLNLINITLDLSDYSTSEKYILSMIARNENSKLKTVYYAIDFDFSTDGLSGLWIAVIVFGSILLVFLGGYFIIGAVRKRRKRLSDLNSERDYQSLE